MTLVRRNRIVIGEQLDGFFMVALHSAVIFLRIKLRDFDGDINRFKVIRLFPSIQEQIAVSKTEPGDENDDESAA